MVGSTTSGWPVRLTGREQDVLDAVATGRDVRQAARALGMSPHTCRGHIKNLHHKLDVRSQLELVTTAARLGLLTAVHGWREPVYDSRATGAPG